MKYASDRVLAAHSTVRVRKEMLQEAKVAFGRTLRQEREALGLSLRDLGKETSISPAFLSLVERGQSGPSPETATRIIEAIRRREVPDGYESRAGEEGAGAGEASAG